MEIINLNENVLNALEFIKGNQPPKFDINSINMAFVVGSGNAINTGKIIFSEKLAIFCDESNFKTILKAYQPIIENKLIKETVIISASGEKDSVWEVEEAKKNGLKTTLLTCEGESSAAKIADKVYVYKKIAEPYTYNYSTYVGMIISSTNESVNDIQNILNNLVFPENFKDYESYSFILSDKYNDICPMLDIKKNELFGPHLSLRSFTLGHARHAGFVHPSEKELVITIGENNEYFGHKNHRWNISIPDNSSFATLVSLTYFIIGKIQELNYPYFKENIVNFCNDYGPKAYGKKQVFDIIVPGS